MVERAAGAAVPERGEAPDTAHARWLRALRVPLFALALFGALRLVQAASTLAPPLVYRKDFLQEYLLGRALLAGVDPYRPIAELAQRFLGALPVVVFPHPSPHPPVMALASAPLALAPYPVAAAAWLAIELACLTLCVRLVAPRATPARVVLATCALIGASAVSVDLILGQLAVPLLTLVVAGARALRDERPALGGTLIGAAVALKLFLWPLLVVLALGRRVRALGAAVGTLAALQLAAVAAIGLAPTLRYYGTLGPAVALSYRGEAANFSAWTLAPKLLAGVGSEVLRSLRAPPLVAAPELAAPLSWILPLAILGVAVAAIARRDALDAQLAIAVCASVVVSPVTWEHYLVLLLIPLAVAGRALLARGLPRAASATWLACAALVALPLRPLAGIARLASGQPFGDETAVVSPLAALIPQLPLAGVIALLVLTAHLTRETPAR